VTVRAISVRELCDDDQLGIDLEVAGGASGLDREVRSTRIQKSGLALAGHYHGIERGRIQIFGVTELTYLRSLDDEVCRDAVRRFFELDLCCVLVTESATNMAPDAAPRRALVSAADAAETPLLLSPERSSRTIMALHALLDERLAPRQRVHGVLVDVFEVGMLLLGTSGVGKSEVALELVMRGHRLVADDVVECHYRPPGMIFGEPADLLRHHLEVRGLGILNVKDLFGVTAVRDRKRIDVVVVLVERLEHTDHDRLGLEQRTHEVLGVRIPELLVPVRPGRDVASILEIAARNELLKTAGHHPAREFFGRLETAMLGHESEMPPAMQAAAEPVIARPPESSVGLPPLGRRAPARRAAPRAKPVDGSPGDSRKK
jgi:HPr kinase/phosphorylase